MKMIDKYGAMTVRGNGGGTYNGVMRTFFATPGINVDGGNLVSNPQFDSGTTDWVSSSGSSNTIVETNILENTGLGTQNVGEARQYVPAYILNHKYYAKGRVRITNTDATSIKLRMYSGASQDFDEVSLLSQNLWYELSGIVVVSETNISNLIYMTHYYANTTDANGAVMEIDGTEDNGILMMDLTDIFGAGNEPDLAFCDAFYKDFFTHAGTDYHGQIRIKPDCPIDSDIVNFRGKTTPWTSDDDITSGYDCGTINTYASGTAYAENDYVISAGTVYRSLLSSNTGNDPSSSPTYWIDVSDLDNNEWYVCMGTSLRNYFKAFPGKNGTYNDEFGQNESSAKAGGLIHEYTMDSVSGSTVYDTVGSKNALVSNITYTDGKVGNTAIFNGSSSRLTPSSTISDSSDFSVSFWINLNNYGTFDGVFGNVGTGNPDMYVTINGSGIVAQRWLAGSMSYSLDLCTDYHVIISNISGYMYLYINGLLVSTSATDWSLDIGVIGRTYLNGAWQYLDGKLDQFRVYNRALTLYEIQNLYNNGNGC